MVRIPDSESFGKMRAQREETDFRVRDLERTDGSQYARALEKIKALIAGLDASVQAAISAYSYTRAQIESLSWLSVLWPAKGGTGTTNAALNTFTSGGPWNIIYGKTATGELGHAPSNRIYKRDIQDAWPSDGQQTYFASHDVDPMRLFDFPVQAFRYIDDVEERGNEAIWQYGFIAEDLAAAGLTPWLQEDNDQSVIGVAYDKLPLANHEAIRRLLADRYEHRWLISELHTQVESLSQRLAALEERSAPDGA